MNAPPPLPGRTAAAPKPPAASVQVRSVAFRRARERQWMELHDLTEKALKAGLQALNQDELHRLPTLYRSALSSLAVARSTALDRRLVEYLEGLAGRAYMAVYGGRRSAPGAVADFFVNRFPQEVRRLGGELALSTLLLLIGVAIAFTLTAMDSEWYFAFVSADLAGGRDPSATTESLREVLYGGGDGELLAFSTYLFTHNYGIGMMAFGLGFLAAVPTALLMLLNGLMLGAFLCLYHSRGMLVPLLGWLLPHGVPELFAVVLCGAAGMALGRAVLWPGERSMAASLMHRGRAAALVVAGSVVLFAVAGVVEGVFRQVVTNDTTRFLVAAFNALWLGVWLLGGGRNNGRRPDLG